MLSKIFLTLTVILAAFIYVRKRNHPGQPLLPSRAKTAIEPEVSQTQSMSDYRFAAYAINYDVRCGGISVLYQLAG